MACIFGAPLTEDRHTVENQKMVKLEAPKIWENTEIQE